MASQPAEGERCVLQQRAVRNGAGAATAPNAATPVTGATEQTEESVKAAAEQRAAAAAKELRARIAVFQDLTGVTGLISTVSIFMFVQSRNTAVTAEYGSPSHPIRSILSPSTAESSFYRPS